MFRGGISVLGIAVFTYLFISQVFAFYFLLDWSKQHSFLCTIVFGIIGSEIKGLLFPFFI
jgi:hypothetical protein